MIKSKTTFLNASGQLLDLCAFLVWKGYMELLGLILSCRGFQNRPRKCCEDLFKGGPFLNHSLNNRWTTVGAILAAKSNEKLVQE